MQRILSYLRKTIENYEMIEEGDKIVGKQLLTCWET